MLEIRVKKGTKKAGLSALAKKSSSFASNQRRFALVLVAGDLKRWIHGDRIRDALRQSPVWDHRVINKVHVRWDLTKINWVPSPIPGEASIPRPKPNLPLGTPLTVLEKIPFEGFNVDGTKIIPVGKSGGKSA